MSGSSGAPSGRGVDQTSAARGVKDASSPSQFSSIPLPGMSIEPGRIVGANSLQSPSPRIVR